MNRPKKEKMPKQNELPKQAIEGLKNFIENAQTATGFCNFEDLFLFETQQSYSENPVLKGVFEKHQDLMFKLVENAKMAIVEIEKNDF